MKNKHHSFRVITSMNRSYYNRIGNKMISSFLKYWPDGIKLTILTEEPPFIKNPSSRISFVNLYKAEPELEKFHHICNLRDDSDELKTSLKKGAFRFSFKSFAIINGCLSSNTDFTIWLDADLITHSKVDDSFFEMFNDQNYFSYFLGRKNTYTETGFLVFNTSNCQNKIFFEEWRKLYSELTIFEQDEWHDCICYDYCRKKVKTNNKNLTPFGKDYDNVIVNSVVAKYFDHLKGDTRKKLGSSFSSDVIDKNASVYSTKLANKNLFIKMRVKLIKLINILRGQA